MDKQLEVLVSDSQDSVAETTANWQGLSDLQLACVGGGIGDTVL